MTEEERIAIWNWSMTAKVSGIPRSYFSYDFQGNYQQPLAHLYHKLVPFEGCFICASNKNGFLLFDREKGDIVKQFELEGCINGIVNNRHNGRYLFVDPYILDLETLEVVHDPWPAFQSYGIEPRPRGRGFVTQNYAVRELNPDKYPGHWWILDLNTWKETIEDVGASWPGWMFYGEDQVVCNASGRLQIRNISDGSVVSELVLPEFVNAVGGVSGIRVEYKEGERGCYIDDRTFEVIGSLDSGDCIDGICFTNFKDRISPLSTFTESVPDGDVVHCYHWKTKELIWRKKFKKFNQSYFSGDLIFASANGDRIIAMDKWTGEIVWNASEPYRPMSIHFYEKDVYFVDMGGNMRAYQWDEEYISPHRPKDTNEAWIRPE